MGRSGEPDLGWSLEQEVHGPGHREIRAVELALTTKRYLHQMGKCLVIPLTGVVMTAAERKGAGNPQRGRGAKITAQQPDGGLLEAAGGGLWVEGRG